MPHARPTDCDDRALQPSKRLPVRLSEAEGFQGDQPPTAPRSRKIGSCCYRRPAIVLCCPPPRSVIPCIGLSDTMCVTSAELEQQQDPRSRALVKQQDLSLAPLEGAPSSLALRESLQEKRRADQRQHHHQQIWTKDPHGGPYKKV